MWSYLQFFSGQFFTFCVYKLNAPLRPILLYKVRSDFSAVNCANQNTDMHYRVQMMHRVA